MSELERTAQLVDDLAAVSGQPTDAVIDALAQGLGDRLDLDRVVVFSPEQVASVRRMDAARARLRELGFRHVDLGQCEHGWTAGSSVQRGRAHDELIAHGAPSPAQALEELILQAERLPRSKPGGRRRHKRRRA